MTMFRDFEAQQQAALRGPKEQLVECKECASTWLELIKVEQFDQNKMSTFLQKPTPASDVHFYVLKCLRCGELHEPPMMRGVSNDISKAYDEMLDVMEEPQEKWGGRTAERLANAETESTEE